MRLTKEQERLSKSPISIGEADGFNVKRRLQRIDELKEYLNK